MSGKPVYVLESYEPENEARPWIEHENWPSLTYHEKALKIAKELSEKYPLSLFRVRAPGDLMRQEYLAAWFIAGESVSFERSEEYLNSYKLPPPQQQWSIQEFFAGSETTSPRWYDKDITVSQRATLAAMANSYKDQRLWRGIRFSDNEALYWQGSKQIDIAVVAQLVADAEDIFKGRQKWLVPSPGSAGISILAKYVSEPGIKGLVRFLSDLEMELSVIVNHGKASPSEALTIQALQVNILAAQNELLEELHDALATANEKTSDAAKPTQDEPVLG